MNTEKIITPSDNIRKVTFKTRGIAASDGNDVQLTRVIGTPELPQLDPFLMLDRFESNQPSDYIGGFPPHPHRGFETVTYLLAGKMRHEDNKGNQGLIETGGVQWMTAGKGIIHSEMPQQTNGLLNGFQLWVNLPAAHKMTPPSYQELSAADIPIEKRAGAQLKVIAGTTSQNTIGPVINHYVAPIMFDVCLEKGVTFTETLPAEDNAFIMVVKGEIELPAANDKVTLKQDEFASLSHGAEIVLSANQDSQFLLVAAKPLAEPIARGGPFVMNTQQEIEQAFQDYRSGNF